MSARGLMRAEVPSATLAIVTDDDLPLLTRSLSGRQLLALDILLAAGYTLVLATMAAAAPPAAAVRDSSPPGCGQPSSWRWAFPLALGGCGRCRVRHQPGGVAPGAQQGVVRDGLAGGVRALHRRRYGGRSAREPPVVALASVLGSWCSSSLAARCHLRPRRDRRSCAVVWAARGPSAVRSASGDGSRIAPENGRSSARSRTRGFGSPDLHDIVAHGLSLIVVRAATANHV